MARQARTRSVPVAPGPPAGYALAMKWRRTKSEHVDYLRGFLEARSFPVRVAAFETAADATTGADS